MFEIFKPKGTVPFMSRRKPFLFLSALIIIASIASLVVNGINRGLDFTGGTLIEVKFEQAVDLDKIRAVLKNNGFADATAQHFGSSSEVMLRMMPREIAAETQQGGKAADSSAMLSHQVIELLKHGVDDSVKMRRIEFVGPSVGAELAEKGGLAVIAALFAILIYVSFRFEWRFAVGAVIALAHDVIATLGLFSLLQIEFDLTVIAALLTVVGYSLNDTIVVSDRIRENFRKLRNEESADVIDISLTQTFSRTIITSLTTVMVLVSLFLLGGELIHSFAIALLFGVIIGTFSSIYVASSFALYLGVKKEDFMITEVEKEGEDQEELML